jgi:hypothetical protein
MAVVKIFIDRDRQTVTIGFMNADAYSPGPALTRATENRRS